LPRRCSTHEMATHLHRPISRSGSAQLTLRRWAEGLQVSVLVRRGPPGGCRDRGDVRPVLPASEAVRLSLDNTDATWPGNPAGRPDGTGDRPWSTQGGSSGLLSGRMPVRIPRSRFACGPHRVADGRWLSVRRVSDWVSSGQGHRCWVSLAPMGSRSGLAFLGPRSYCAG
jgi:hypothetical protein